VLKRGIVKAHAALGKDWPAGLALRSADEDYLDLSTKYYLSRQGDVLATYSEIGHPGHELVVVLNAQIARISVQMALRGRLDIDKAGIEMLLKVLRPFATLEYLWEYHLEGTRAFEAAGFSATGVRLKRAASVEGPADVPWKCVLRFGGASVLETLRNCLSSLVEGPASYIECVAGKAGEDTARIALHMAKWLPSGR